MIEFTQIGHWTVEERPAETTVATLAFLREP